MTMLATDPTDAIEQLTGILNSANRITAWVGTLMNAVIPPMTPAPAWYDTITAELSTSQSHSTSWRSSTAPDIVAGMTGAFISYAQMFANAVPYLSKIVGDARASGGSPTTDQLNEMVDIVTMLRQEVARHRSRTQELKTTIAAYRDQMQADRDALDASIKSAWPQEVAARAAVQQVQTQIASIEQTIAADSASASSSDVDEGSAITSLVIAVTFTAGFDPVGFGIALLFVGVDAVLDAEAHARVVSDLKQLETLTTQLTDDEMQLGMVQGVLSNLERLASGVDEALATFDDFDDTWSVAKLSLDYLLVILKQPKIDVSTIPDLNNLDDAVAAWNDVSAFATKVQATTLMSAPPLTITSNA